MPYLNEKSEIIGKRLTEFVNDYFDKVNLRVAFRAKAQLRDLFPFKDKVTDPRQQSKVEYHIKCKDCDYDYIGETESKIF